MTPPLARGLEEAIPYSLSRWTDLPASKWAWFLTQLDQGWMHAFDPQTAVPRRWSLAPEDTLGMVFWTKDPSNLLVDKERLAGQKVTVHVTATGWREVERGAPRIESSIDLLARTAEAYGPKNVTWRFSPVPLVEDALERFTRLAEAASQAGITRVYLSFLQTNDRIPETRDRETKLALLASFAKAAPGLRVLLCNEDRTLHRIDGLPQNLSAGVCAPPEDYGRPGANVPPSEGCGCVLMADPFTVNESCHLGCQYCYAADGTLAPKKRNTTKGLPMLARRP
jgi:Domain of unknown function (DUF1848)